MNKIRKTAALSVFASILTMYFHSPAQAIDSVSLELGSGDRTDITRVSAQQHWNHRWLDSNGTHLSGYWDFSGAYWKENRHRNIVGKSNTFFDVGMTPVFRFEKSNGFGWYAEAGVGIHYLSELYDNNDSRLSTHFQFGDHVGIGYVSTNKIDIGIRLQHFSNGGYKKPNSGVDFLLLKITYLFN